MEVTSLNFQPFPGTTSCHFQTIIPTFLSPGRAPLSERLLIDIEAGDYLACEVSTPAGWTGSDQTVVLVHGMGGSHSSSYMIRMARKLYLRGDKVVRVNLRNCGSGRGLSKLLYNAGTSPDVLKVLEVLKKEAPLSEISLVGFSLGGNLVLKLAGELGPNAKTFVKTFIAVCPPIDLAQGVRSLEEKRNRIYHSHYLKEIKVQAGIDNLQNIRSIYEFDDAITGPSWGYGNASNYYQECSAIGFLSRIEQSTHLLFAQDDPFVSFDRLQEVSLPSAVRVWVTKHGGHMGFLGKTSKRRSLYWMDDLLLSWLKEQL